MGIIFEIFTESEGFILMTDHLKSLDKISQEELEVMKEQALNEIAKEVGNRISNRTLPVTATNLAREIIDSFLKVVEEKGNVWMDGEWHYWDKRETNSPAKCIFLRMCFALEQTSSIVLRIPLKQARKTDE